MIANGCSAEAADLIEALDELMSSRYSSRREFVEAVAALSPGDELVSEKMLSEQMGSSNPRFNRGPTWKTARLIAGRCAPEGRWILEVARIAGLWARANDAARPPGYDGPIFPAGTSADLMAHQEALMADFPLARQSRRRCPRTFGRWMLGVLLRAVVLWVAVDWIFGVHISFGWLTGQARAAGMSAADWWGAGMAAGIGMLAVIGSSVWYVRIRPGWGVILGSPRANLGDSVFFETSRAATAGFWRAAGIPAPVLRHLSLANEITWSLPPGALVITPLGLRPLWSIILHVWFIASRLAACVNGTLDLVVDAEDGEDRIVEWALVGDEGYVHATGLLPAPVLEGFSRSILLPGHGRVLGRRLYDGDLAKSRFTDHDLADLSPGAVRSTDLTGRVNWPAAEQVNIILRRLDANPHAIEVKWANAGMHIHRTYPAYDWH